MFAKILALMTVSALALSSAANADVEISGKPTANMSCDVGVCTATAAKAVLNVGDLQTMLTSGDVAVKTGTLAKDIDIDQPLTWATTSRLTLDAQQSVTVKKQVTVSGTGNLTIVTNDGGGKKGEFIIAPEHGSVQFWDLASSLIIDGNSYALVGDIKTLATDIATNPLGFYALAKPYDASVDGVYSSSPIATEFTGLFEGLGNSISNLVMSLSSDEPEGFFAIIGPKGVIRDSGLLDVRVEGSDFFIVGLVAGVNEGTIKRDWVIGSMKYPDASGNSMGGLVGTNDNVKGPRAIVEECFANVDIELGKGGLTYTGALIGENYAGTVKTSYAGGTIRYLVERVSNAGGLAGYNSGLIENSFAQTLLKDGRNDLQNNFGGLIGENDTSGTVTSAYSAGGVKQGHDSQLTLGGLIGSDLSQSGNLAETYWDLDKGVSNPAQGAGNIPNDSGITGVTDAQLKSGLPPGFDPKVWNSDPKINNGYPYLLANPPSSPKD